MCSGVKVTFLEHPIIMVIRQNNPRMTLGLTVPLRLSLQILNCFFMEFIGDLMIGHKINQKKCPIINETYFKIYLLLIMV
jgi:hypothetical protein